MVRSSAQFDAASILTSNVVMNGSLDSSTRTEPSWVSSRTTGDENASRGKRYRLPVPDST